MAISASEARKNLFPLIEQVNNDRKSLQTSSSRDEHSVEIYASASR